MITADRVLENYVVIIGAQRSGSTLLHSVLDSHPEVSMIKPVRPEPKVFLDPDLNSDRLRRWIDGRLDQLEAGSAWFGEKSTSYIESEQAADAVMRLVPSARVVAIVRDPIQRAISNYRFSRDAGLETAPIEVALRRELDGTVLPPPSGISVSPFAYLDRGLYSRHLSRYVDRLGHHRIHVVVLEELTRQPDHLRDLFRWLGIDDRHRPRLDSQVNLSDGPNPTVPEDLRIDLRKYFDRTNRELARQFGLDLGQWR